MLSALATPVLHSSDVGVSASRTRRRFTTTYKLKILTAVADCTQHGDVAALLRREGLYASHLAAWRAAQRRGEYTDLTNPARRRGPRPRPADPSAKRIAALERQLAQATARAERAEAIVEVQKKVTALVDQMDRLPGASSAAPTGAR